MADNKRKLREETNHKHNKVGKKPKQSKSPFNKSKKRDDKSNKRKKTGPRLPSAFSKELERFNNPVNSDEEHDEIDSDEANDVYEYEEDVPQEESGKNRRFDPVDNYEYELPEDFEDEDVKSDDDNDDDNEDDKEDRQEQDEDEGRHARMLQGITGIPSEAFEGKKKKKFTVVSEAYPESEFNPTRDVLDGGGHITIEDLLDPLQGKSGYSKLRKSTQQMEKKSSTIEAPLPKPTRDKLERKAAYEHSKKDITKWEPLVKRNREAPTLYFDKDIDLKYSTVGAIASQFEPRTDFEKKMASLVYDEKVMEAHKNDGARLLEFNEVSIEDEKERQNRIAKMRSLLFRHEMKKKRVKKIKSKTYHRLSKKDRLKAATLEMEMDPEAAKEQAMKLEFKRAEERMTLKHKNSSKWAKRILKRGLSAQDEGTRSALAEQLHQHALLTRKMNTMKDSSSSSEDSSDEEDDEKTAGSDQDEASTLLAKAQEKTRKLMEEEEELPKKGLLSLPFMARGLKKREEEAYEEAQRALEEYEKQLDDTTQSKKPDVVGTSGRRVFGAASKPTQNPTRKINTDRDYNDSDNDNDNIENFSTGNDESNGLQKDAHVDSVLTSGNVEIRQDPLLKGFDDIVKDPGPKTTYEVAIFASGGWKKIKSGKEEDTEVQKSPAAIQPALENKDMADNEKEADEDSDTDSEGQMVDGILTSGSQPSYKLPSHAELIREAFAGDDVEEEFEKDKEEVLNEENPEPEKPVLLPGWGQWTNIQQKKGLPSWMVKEHEDANRKRQEALKKRKDAGRKHVIISEKLDKKADKLLTKSLPYPFTSKEVFEQSLRMPIGPEFNPTSAVGDLIRPEVVKKPGIIIKPIKFEDVNPHEESEDRKPSGQKQKTRKGKNSGSKPVRIKST